MTATSKPNFLHVCAQCRTVSKIPYQGDVLTWCATCGTMTPHKREKEARSEMDISSKIDRFMEAMKLQQRGPAKPAKKPDAESMADKLRKAEYPARAIDGLARMRGPGLHAAQMALDILTGKPDAHLILFGPNGTGKTQIATWLAANRVEEGQRPGRYIALPEWAQIMEGDIARGMPKDERMEPIKRTKFLVVDEAQDMGRSDWIPQAFRDLADRRYRDFLPMVWVMNANTPDEAHEKLGARIVDRANETGGMIHCAWPSYRAK